MVETVSWKPFLWHGLGGAAKKIFSASSLGPNELQAQHNLFIAVA